MITEILTPKHPAFDKNKADGAISADLGGLLDMDVVKIFLADTVPRNANDFWTRIVLAIKNFEAEAENWKARIVVQGFMDRESKQIASDAGFVAAMSRRMFLVLGFALGYTIWTRDVKQAYLQGGKLNRNIYARPQKEMRSACADISCGYCPRCTACGKLASTGARFTWPFSPGICR